MSKKDYRVIIKKEGEIVVDLDLDYVNYEINNPVETERFFGKVIGYHRTQSEWWTSKSRI